MSKVVDMIDCLISKSDSCAGCHRHEAWVRLANLAFFCGAVVVLSKGSNAEFSTVLTMSSIVQCLSFFVLTIKVNYQKSVAGLSSRMLEMYVVFFCFRLCSTIFKNGYIPVDKSGDWIYQVADLGCLLVVLNLIYSVHRRYNSTYEAENDTLPAYKAIPAVILLAFFCRGDLNGSAFYDTVWMISCLLDTISLLPQLWMFTKTGGKVEMLTAHFVATIVVSRALSFAFWWFGYKEVAPLDGSVNIPGYTIIAAHAFQMLLCADFLYYYVKGLRSVSGQVVLPDLEV